MKQNRKLNIELLRIFSMLLITLFHVKQHFIDEMELGNSIYKIFMDYVMMFIPFHVDLFILITGYFGLRNSKRHLLHIVLLLYFYSISINLITYSIEGGFSLADVLLPISQRRWWFMTMYILMLFIAPLIENYVKDNPRKAVNRMMIVALFINLYLSHFRHVRHLYDEGFGIVNFACIYVLGVWLRKEGMQIVAKLKYPRLSFTFAILAIILIQYKSMPFFTGMELAEYCGPYATFMAVFVFLLFTKIHVPESFRSVIMFFSSSAVAVYLITDYPSVYRMLQPLFSMWYQPEHNNITGIVIIFMSVIIAFISCCFIDKIRIPITNYVSKRIINMNQTIRDYVRI